MAFNLGDIFVTFKAKSEGFSTALNNVKKSADQIQKTSEKIGAFGKKTAEIGSSLTTRLTLPIAAAAAGSVKLSTDFNNAMANIATLIPGNSARVAELKEEIQSLAVESGKGTADLADGMYNVLSAFGDTADGVKILEVNAKAARAGLAQTGDAINLTSGVTKAYGDTTAEAVQKASDLALMTVRLGQTTFPELASSMGRVTPLAASLNVTQEELFGTMATFTGVTGGAAEVSTQLRGVMQALMAPTGDMQTLMKDLGFESGKAMIEQLGLQGSIEAMTKASKQSGKPLQAFIGSIEGQTLALAATGGQADNFKQKIGEMANVAGTTDVAFGEATSGVNEAGFAMDQARAKAEVAAQKMGDALAPAIEKVSEWVGRLADWFANLDPEGQKVILMVGGIIAIMGPALILIGKIAIGIKAIAGAMAFVAANPVVLVVTGILLAIAGIAFLIIRNWDKVKGWFKNFWNWLKRNWGTLVAVLFGPFGLAVKWIISNWKKIKGFFSSLVSSIGRSFGRVVDLITGPFKAAFNAIARLWNDSIGSLSFEAPDWVPGLGGKGFSMPKLPLLAQGGIVDKATLAVVGEGAEPEAVIPLSKIGEVAAQMGAEGGQVAYNIHLDGVIARSGSELRDIMMEALKEVDRKRTAQGKPEILQGGA